MLWPQPYKHNRPVFRCQGISGTCIIKNLISNDTTIRKITVRQWRRYLKIVRWGRTDSPGRSPLICGKSCSTRFCKGLTDWLYSMFILHHSWIDLCYIIWTAIMYLLLYRYSSLCHSPIIIVKFVTAPIRRCEHMDKRIVNLCESLWILVHRPPQWTLNSLDSRKLGIAFTDSSLPV